MKKKAGTVLLAGGLICAVLLLKGVFSGVDVRQGIGSAGENRSKFPEQEKTFFKEETQPVCISADRYVYNTLNDEEKQVYDEILSVMLGHEREIRVNTLDIAVLDRAYKSVCADYGNLFWVSGYVYTQYTRGEELVGLEFAPQYTMTRRERERVQARIDERTEKILSGIPAEASDYEKAKYIFDYLASNVDYDVGAVENQNIISVFLYGKTVCQGYANATQYLLWEEGIESAVVTGEANGEPHAWNLARLDGEYYYIDTTWGNSAYVESAADDHRFINYGYFCITSGEIGVSHNADDNIRLPETSAVQNNYYVREGKYFSEWDPEAVGSVLKAAYEEGCAAVSVKFAREELYRQAKQYFMEEGHIGDYCAGLRNLYYMEDVQQRILTLYF